MTLTNLYHSITRINHRHSSSTWKKTWPAFCALSSRTSKWTMTYRSLFVWPQPNPSSTSCEQRISGSWALTQYQSMISLLGKKRVSVRNFLHYINTSRALVAFDLRLDSASLWGSDVFVKESNKIGSKWSPRLASKIWRGGCWFSLITARSISFVLFVSFILSLATWFTNTSVPHWFSLIRAIFLYNVSFGIQLRLRAEVLE